MAGQSVVKGIKDNKWLIGTLVCKLLFPTISTWQANNMADSIIIAAFYGANFVYDEYN